MIHSPASILQWGHSSLIQMQGEIQSVSERDLVEKQRRGNLSKNGAPQVP